jgi:hypothetical protein
VKIAMSANHGSGRAGTNFELAGTIGPAGRSMGGMIAQLIAAYHPARAKPSSQSCDQRTICRMRNRRDRGFYAAAELRP